VAFSPVAFGDSERADVLSLDIPANGPKRRVTPNAGPTRRRSATTFMLPGT